MPTDMFSFNVDPEAIRERRKRREEEKIKKERDLLDQQRREQCSATTTKRNKVFDADSSHSAGAGNAVEQSSFHEKNMFLNAEFETVEEDRQIWPPPVSHPVSSDSRPGSVAGTSTVPLHSPSPRAHSSSPISRELIVATKSPRVSTPQSNPRLESFQEILRLTDPVPCSGFCNGPALHLPGDDQAASIHSPKKNGSSKKSHSGEDSRGISPDSQLTDVEDRDLSIRDGDGVLLFRNHISEAIPSGSTSPSSSHSSPVASLGRSSSVRKTLTQSPLHQHSDSTTVSQSTEDLRRLLSLKGRESDASSTHSGDKNSSPNSKAVVRVVSEARGRSSSTPPEHSKSRDFFPPNRYGTPSIYEMVAMCDASNDISPSAPTSTDFFCGPSWSPKPPSSPSSGR